MSSRFSFCFLLGSVLLLGSTTVIASESAPRYGGVFLEYPQGRYQENAAPNFFKWNLQTRTSSIALKVLRCEQACTPQSAKELVARFDFLPDVQSMNWFGEALPVGHYIWSVEGFNNSSANPVFSDTASFSIEPIMSYGFKTRRLGLLAGFGRGNYSSGDVNYDVEFRTTPTIYGLSFGGGSKTNIWNFEGFLSDFILKGQLYQTITFSSEYLWQLDVSDPGRFLFFVGPSLKFFNYPQIVSVNGIDLNINNESIFSPGLALKSQYEIDKYIALQMGLTYNVAVFGSEKVDFELQNGSLNGSIGLTYGKMWPVGIGGEIQYQRDRIGTTPEGGNPIVVEQSQWVILLHLFYAI